MLQKLSTNPKISPKLSTQFKTDFPKEKYLYCGTQEQVLNTNEQLSSNENFMERQNITGKCMYLRSYKGHYKVNYN